MRMNKAMKKQTQADEKYPDLVEAITEATGIPPQPEFKFHPTRKWKFDYAFPEQQIAVEVEGGIYGYKDKSGKFKSRGAHSSITGIKRDIEKYNAATVLGWKVLRLTSEQAREPQKGLNKIIEQLNALLWKD